MRRSASEIIRNLEQRTDRLERQAHFKREAGVSIKELLDLGIITEDQYMQAKKVEQMGGSKGLPKVGDILVAINAYYGLRSSFYQVLEVSKSFKTITVVQLETVGRNLNSVSGGSVMPIKDQHRGRPMRKKVNIRPDGYTFKVDRYTGSAEIWDGTPQPYEMD